MVFCFWCPKITIDATISRSDSIRRVPHEKPCVPDVAAPELGLDCNGESDMACGFGSVRTERN
jgi:hypothetical protein